MLLVWREIINANAKEYCWVNNTVPNEVGIVASCCLAEHVRRKITG